MGFFDSLIGSIKKTNYPFDKDKAYYYMRQGVIAGGGFQLSLSPENIVKCYSYVKPTPQNECGMRDRGADLYFVGLKEGEVMVTLTYKYPTCEPEQDILTLRVDKDLTVRKIN